MPSCQVSSMRLLGFLLPSLDGTPEGRAHPNLPRKLGKELFYMLRRYSRRPHTTQD